MIPFGVLELGGSVAGIVCALGGVTDEELGFWRNRAQVEVEIESPCRFLWRAIWHGMATFVA